MLVLSPVQNIVSGSSAAIARPTFSRDFAGEKTLNNGTGPAITFTRASNATFFDANGTLQTAANDTPRFDHDPATGASRGLLIEEARTNSIRNAQAGGATVGVIGSGGALPTNYNMSSPTGIAREVVATGTINGMNYVDLRWSGTRSGGSVVAIQIVPESFTQIVATSGQTWTGGMYIALVAGSYTNLTSPQHGVTERNSSGVALDGTGTAFTATSTLTRVTTTRTFNNASTARTTNFYNMTVADGATIDITLRIAAPQLEQGAFPTSYIPTTTAAATRAADSALVTPISSFYNQAEGTLFAEAMRTNAVDSGVFPTMLRFQADDPTVRMSLLATNGRAYFSAVNVSTTEWDIDSSLARYGITLGTAFKIAGGYAADNVAASMNGQSVDTDTSAQVLSGLTNLRIGQASSSGFFNGHLRKIAYWPKRLSNTLLQQLTT
jgi:hypothetical protein